jgi:hypothetical protein
MKSKFLAAAASVAFIAAGVAAQAQEPQKHDQGAAKAQAEQRHEEMKGGEMKGAQGANPAARAEGERNETKGGQGAERPRAAEAAGQEKRAEQGQNEQRQGAEGKRAAEPNGEKSPAARTGANEQERNGARTGANEEKRNERTGANEQERNGARTGANDEKRNERTGANEQERNGARTAEGHGPARVEGNVKMSTEHATRVSESLRRDGRRENVNVNVRVGERLPESVVVRPLPEDVIAIVPEYRGYDYFIDENDEIVFVAPQTHEVVGMIDYEGRAASVDNYTHVGASRPCPTE